MNLHALAAALVTGLVVLTVTLAIYGAHDLCHRLHNHLEDAADQRAFERTARDAARTNPLPEYAYLVGDEPLEDPAPGSDAWLIRLFHEGGWR